MSNEWYTPARYVKAAREVMGAIELDPASCAFANRVVKAERIYTKADNGLLHPWSARSVFLNPPYGRTSEGRGSNLEHFTRYALEQYRCGNTAQAILLLPVNTATRWFAPLWAYPICFPTFRIRFYTERGPSDGSSFGTCFIYLGPHVERFIDVFRAFGPIAQAVAPARGQLQARELWTEALT